MQTDVVLWDGVLFLVVCEEVPVSGWPQRDGYLQRETVYSAGPPLPDPTGTVGGVWPTWDRIAWRQPDVAWNAETRRNDTGEVQARWRHPHGAGVRLYATPGSVPPPTARRTPLDSVRISDWAREVVVSALTQACAALWTIDGRRPETVADVQGLWTRIVIAASRGYLQAKIESVWSGGSTGP